ncbi:MAG: phosphoglycerate dehydrogenase [Oscillospiraceae bacterium]|nr:phosphoglycerate dehydrogenase [Oscillospiraceae bacterium]
MKKVLVTPRSFAKTDDAPVRLLQEAGYTIVRNPAGKIMTKEEMQTCIADVDGVIIGVDPLDADVLACAKNLRAIAKYGVGTDNIDKNYAASHHIPVSITAGANSNAVADYAFALMMGCARRVVKIDAMCHEKQWTKVMGADVYGKTVGIFGLGAIGKGVAKRAAGFDMQVLAYDVFWDDAYAAAHGITRATPAEIFRQADFISLHLPLTDETRGIIGAAELATMKPNVVLVNTARGGLIDEPALIAALQQGRIWGAGIDVFEQEPPANPELYTLDNLIMGSHCAASTNGASETMSMMAAQNLLRDLQ